MDAVPFYVCQFFIFIFVFIFIILFPNSQTELESRHAASLREIESNRRTLHSNEIRYNEMLKDKASLTTESVELRAALMKAKERTDIEYAIRMQTESVVESLKRYTIIIIIVIIIIISTIIIVVIIFIIISIMIVIEI